METKIEIVNYISKLIRQAGQAALSFYGKNYNINDKGNDSPVTEADLASEKIILEGLQKYGYGILSEETHDDRSRLKKDRVWIVDPLDGTKDFIEKTGEFTIMIALVENGEPVLGLVYQPVGDTLYYAAKGEGAYKQVGKEEPGRIRVSSENNFEKALMFTSRHHQSDLEREFIDCYKLKAITRGSSKKICEIAEGAGELNFNPTDKMKEWDLCAADIILSEAGGRLTDLDGNKYKYNQADPHIHGYLATNGLIHNRIIEEIKMMIEKDNR